MNRLDDTPFSVQPPRRSRGCALLISLSVILLVALTVGLLDDLIESVSASLGLTHPLAPEQRPIESPELFDPYAAYAQAVDFAGEGAQLLEIRVNYVRSDGTLDLMAEYTPRPNAEYRFVVRTDPPENAPPLGAGGTVDGNWYQFVSIHAEQPGRRYTVSTTSGNTQTQYTYRTQGWRRGSESVSNQRAFRAIDPPACSLADLWEVAIRRDAPRDAVAVVTYDHNGYTFAISPLLLLRFDPDCTPRQ